MNCDICKVKEAVIHIKQILEGREETLNLCETCASLKGIETDKNSVEFSISSLLTGLVDIQSLAQKTNINKTCPGCHLTLEKFKKLSKLGCEDCYGAFSDEIHSILNRMYGQVDHQGKFPDRYKEYREHLKEIDKLKEVLNEVLKTENYEEAAKIRDRINVLEKNTNLKPGMKND